MSSCHLDYKQSPPDSVASDAAPNEDRAGVSRCSEGDHEGHIREVLKNNKAQECTLLKSCACRKEEFQPYCNYRWKTNIQDRSGYVVDICT